MHSLYRCYNNKGEGSYSYGLICLMASQLSHRSKLPSWNRPGLCRKSGTDVRRLTRDQLSPLPPVISDSTHDGGEEGGTSSRAVQLEKNILFLNQQHQETLKQLHKEIERLKNENRGQCSIDVTLDVRWLLAVCIANLLWPSSKWQIAHCSS